MVNKSLSEINENCWYKKICKDDCDTCSKYYIIKKLMQNANVAEKLQGPIKLTPSDEDYDKFVRLSKIKDNVDDFVNDGQNLYICSENTGNGKTSWALKIMYKFFSLNWDICDWTEPLALFIYVPEFIISLKDFNNPVSKSYIESVKNVPLVIWDDIGTGTLSEYDYTQLAVYLNTRNQSQLSNIFTSNLTTLKELSDKVGDKLASRIFNSSEIIELKGMDMR